MSKPKFWFAITLVLVFLASCLPSTSVNAQEPAPTGPVYTYIGMEPDIITNYAGDNSQRLGYVRITIELMIVEPNHLEKLEHHMPLLRAAAIEMIGAQTQEKIKSLSGREDLRRMLLQRIQELMRRETGDEVVKNLIFTKFLRQGD